MTRYSKAVAALVGLGVLTAYRWWGVDIAGSDELMRQFLVEITGTIATLGGVYQATNAQA